MVWFLGGEDLGWLWFVCGFRISINKVVEMYVCVLWGGIWVSLEGGGMIVSDGGVGFFECVVI